MPSIIEANEALVAGWIQHTLAPSDATFAAWDELTLLSTHDEARAWPMVLALVARTPPEHLGAVGAGPLESLLHAFPASVGPKAAREARRDPRFRTALERVWLSRGATPASVREELVLATGGKLLLLD